MILISDVLGLEALLDTMTHERFLASHQPKQPGDLAETTSTSSGGLEAVTLSAILGPFYRTGAPECENGQSMVLTAHKDDVTTRMFGKVKSHNGNVLPGAKIE